MVRAMAGRSLADGTSTLTPAINATDDPDVYRELAVLLTAEPEAVRIAAAAALGDAGNPEALETLEPLLGDTSPRVRLRAIEAVTRFGAVDDLVPAIGRLIATDPDPLVRRLAVYALFVVRDDPAASAALVTAASDSDPEVREMAQRIIAQRG